MKLHLGCGHRYLPGYQHIDIQDGENIHIQCDIKNLSEFIHSSTVTEIYACQVLSYFSREELPQVLSEWYRVLKPGGRLRLSVPDFSVLCKFYNAGLSLDWLIGTLYGRCKINNQYIYHKTTFDCHSIIKILNENKFKNICFWNPSEVFPDDYDDLSRATFPPPSINEKYQTREKIIWNLNIIAEKQ